MFTDIDHCRCCVELSVPHGTTVKAGATILARRP